MPRGRGFTRGYSRGGRGGGAARGGRQPLTHFLCLPLVTELSRSELQASVERFKQIVKTINETPSNTISGQSSVPPRAIRLVDSIHLTLGVMSLQDESKLQEAIDLLSGLDIKQLLEPSKTTENQPSDKEPELEPLRVSLRSLISMHTPTETSVLYTEPVDATNRLYSFGERLQAQFRQGGFMEDDKRPLKLHATVLNTVYVKTGRDRLRINATQLLEECKEFSWAQNLRIEKLAICKMGAKKEFDQNGDLLSEKYEEVFAVNLPG
jgi:activating signal cointegrator complex subunit 1